MRAAFYSDRELLQSIKHLCTEKNCFRSAKPDDTVLEYYRGTMQMIDDELGNDSSLTKERLETIVSNMLTVVGNAALYFDGHSKDHHKDPISFTDTDIDCQQACRFIGESTKIVARHETYETKMRSADEHVDIAKRHKVMRLLKSSLLILLAVGVLIFISGLFFSSQPNQKDSVTFFGKIVNWYKYDLMKEAVPVSFAEKWVQFSRKTGYVTACVTGIWIVQAIISRICQVLSQRKKERILLEWNDYQNLCNAFEAASSQMNELEW